LPHFHCWFWWSNWCFGWYNVRFEFNKFWRFFWS